MRKNQHWRIPDCKLLTVYTTLVPNSPGASSCVDDIDKVLARDYRPSDQDALKARLNTVGVQEYNLSTPRDGMCTPFQVTAAHFLIIYQATGRAKI